MRIHSVYPNLGVQYKKTMTINKKKPKMVFIGVCVAPPLQRSVSQHETEHDFHDNRCLPWQMSTPFEQYPKVDEKSHPLLTKLTPLEVVYFSE